MVRLIISFVLAVLGHVFLLQSHLDMHRETPPRLISDSSVSVTLNTNLEKQLNDSGQVSPQSEKELEQESKPDVSPPIPPQTVTNTPTPKKQQVPEVKTITSSTRKIKRNIKQPEPEQVIETTSVTEVKNIEDVSKTTVLETPKWTTVEKTDHKDLPVSSESMVAKQNDTSSSTITSSSVIDAQPLYQYNPKPQYPGLARRRGWEGVVMLLVEVTEKGKVASVQLHESCGYKILDKSAVRAVTTWHFLPGTKNGKRTHSTVLIPVHFKLQN